MKVVREYQFGTDTIIKLEDGWLAEEVDSMGTVIVQFDCDGNIVARHSTVPNREVTDFIVDTMRLWAIPADVELQFVETSELNPFASAETAYNGGGYFQPYTALEAEDGTRIEVYDTSCGDFGSRIEVVFYLSDGNVHRVHYDSMDGEERDVELPVECHRYAIALHEKLDYHIPDYRIRYHIG